MVPTIEETKSNEEHSKNALVPLSDKGFSDSLLYFGRMIIAEYEHGVRIPPGAL